MRDLQCSGCRRTVPSETLKMITDPTITPLQKRPRCASCRENIERINLERTYLRRAITELALDGWRVSSIHDGEEMHQIPDGRLHQDIKWALEVCTSVDESTVYVTRDNERSWFQVILGNGIDLIPDYGTNIDTVMSAIYDHFE